MNLVNLGDSPDTEAFEIFPKYLNTFRKFIDTQEFGT